MPTGSLPYTFIYALLVLAVLVTRLGRLPAEAAWLILAMQAWALAGMWRDSREHQGRGWLLGALVASLLGDVALNFTPWKALCLPPFVCAHLCLFAIFRSLRPRHPRPLGAALLLLGCGSGFYAWLWPSFPGYREAAVAAAYMALLFLMAWRALGLSWGPSLLAGRWLLPAALCYYATDHLVIYHQMHGNRVTLALIWIFYPLALYLLGRAAPYLPSRSPA